MRKLRIIKDNIISTWLFSLVIVVSITLSVVLLSTTYHSSFGQMRMEDYAIYNSELKDYSVVSFKDLPYIKIKEKVDMTGYAGIIPIAREEYKINEEYKYYDVEIVTPTMVKYYQRNGFDFNPNVPNTQDYREGVVSSKYSDYFKIGEYYEYSYKEGIYNYSVKVKIIGYTDNTYYDFNGVHYDFDNTLREIGLLICDNPPNYFSIPTGLMINDKSTDYYKENGFSAKTLEEYNDEFHRNGAPSYLFYWCICIILLVAVITLANYLFSADKIIKRSGIMYISGSKRLTIVLMELFKMLTLYIIAIILSAVIISIIIPIGLHNGTIFTSWASYGISLGIVFAIYILSILIGFIKIIKTPLLKAIGGEYIE